MASWSHGIPAATVKDAAEQLGNLAEAMKLAEGDPTTAQVEAAADAAMHLLENAALGIDDDDHVQINMYGHANVGGSKVGIDGVRASVSISIGFIPEAQALLIRQQTPAGMLPPPVSQVTPTNEEAATAAQLAADEEAARLAAGGAPAPTDATGGLADTNSGQPGASPLPAPATPGTVTDNVVPPAPIPTAATGAAAPAAGAGVAPGGAVPAPAGAGTPPPTTGTTAAGTTSTTADDTKGADDSPKVSKAAEELAAANGIDLTTLTGSGANGLIVKSDVEAAVAAKAKA